MLPFDLYVLPFGVTSFHLLCWGGGSLLPTHECFCGDKQSMAQTNFRVGYLCYSEI